VLLCRIECPEEINTSREEEKLSLRKFIRDRDLRSEDSDVEEEDPARERIVMEVMSGKMS
jgi:hypothetical protein